MTRLFSPGNSGETVLFGGPEPNRDSLSGPLKADMPKEQPTISAVSGPGFSARDSAPIRLRTVRVWFHPKGLELMEDIKRKGLKDVVFDAIALQDLGDQHQAQNGHNKMNDAFLVDLAVLETGISRVLGKYGILKFVPLSNDDPIIVQQPAEDLDSKKALCYQRLHSKYSQEYVKRQRLTKVLGIKMNKLWTDWYVDCLREIGNRLRKLGYC
ncbi:hypothetical protein N7475_000290 [Penicillium sp. IBT 31633x]|nr:hypothetical protein N7475_000290 [Penicillium sp. IBT 31633x]